MFNPTCETESNDINTNASHVTDYQVNQRSHFNDITISNHDHVYVDNELSDDAQEKQSKEELNDMNTIQQIQTNRIVPPGTAELTEQITVHHNRFTFLSRILFFQKSEAHRLKLFEIYRFADKFDVSLMIIGTIAG